MKNPDKNYVDRVEFVLEGYLIRKDFFSYTRVFLNIMPLSKLCQDIYETVLQ